MNPARVPPSSGSSSQRSTRCPRFVHSIPGCFGEVYTESAPSTPARSAEAGSAPTRTAYGPPR